MQSSTPAALSINCPACNEKIALDSETAERVRREQEKISPAPQYVATSAGMTPVLQIPLDGELVGTVPFPMSLESYELLIATLELWKRKLVDGSRDRAVTGIGGTHAEAYRVTAEELRP